jgi:ABC-type Fe3+/spermidine/putrescine transport system ATPase subunit
MVLLGPTGAGKTTLLNIVSGLIEYEGSILFDGVSMDEIPVNRRGFGYLFQDLALFPHLDVTSNITYGLKMQKRRVDEIEARLHEMLNLMNIGHLARRYPKDLSGGEKQRVALARAIAPSPEVLLLDEPFNSLDSRSTKYLMLEFRRMLKGLGLTTIFVTHDLVEAKEMADRIAILDSGRFVQIGTPQEIFFAPNSYKVSDFLGLPNTFDYYSYKTPRNSQVNKSYVGET